jgi:tRNA dimethylallyltransferase
MNHLISLVGTTATGKTQAAYHLADQLLLNTRVNGVDIISADSRQVYQNLEVITGADVPEQAAMIHVPGLSYPCFSLADQRSRLHGISILPPTDTWSLAEFQELVHSVLRVAGVESRAVIVVGGTGLYQSHLLDPDIAKQPAPDLELRAELSVLTVGQLQERLMLVDQLYWQQMNHSDRSNPRRLIRAIEKAKKSLVTSSTPTGNTESWQQHVVRLEVPKNLLAEKIRQRVVSRLASDASVEALQLELQCEKLSLSPMKVLSFSTCGVRESLLFAKGELSWDDCVELWTRREISYAKRQLTWWKKQPVEATFAVEDENWLDQLTYYVVKIFSS